MFQNSRVLISINSPRTQPLQQFQLNLETCKTTSKVFKLRNLTAPKEASQNTESQEVKYERKLLTASLGMSERLKIPISYVQINTDRTSVFSASSGERSFKQSAMRFKPAQTGEVVPFFEPERMSLLKLNQAQRTFTAKQPFRLLQQSIQPTQPDRHANLTLHNKTSKRYQNKFEFKTRTIIDSSMQLNGKQKVFVSMLDGLRTSKAEDSVRF